MYCKSPWCGPEAARGGSDRRTRRTRRATTLALLGFALGGLPHVGAAQGSAPAAGPRPPVEAERLLRTPRLAGQGSMRVLGLAIYDAWLWVDDGFEAPRYAQHPLLLELRYARSLRGADIARRSLVEMRQIAAVGEDEARSWLEFMGAAFPDVIEGDRLSGALLPGRGARFAFNGGRERELADARFAQAFFGIWLSAQTSAPGLRAKLLGLPA